MCFCVQVRVSAWAHAHVCVSRSVCSHNMRSLDLWGARVPLSSSPFSISASSRLWIFTGQEHFASAADATSPLHWAFLGGCLLLERIGECFCSLDAWCFHHLGLAVNLSASGSVFLICQYAWSKLSAFCVLGIYKGEKWCLFSWTF